MNLVVLPAAERDIVEQGRFYAFQKRNPAVAARFLEAVQSTLDTIRANPGLGASKHIERSELSGLRVRPVEGFASLRIYYLESADAVRVIRVLHGKRDLKSIMEGEAEDLPLL